VGKLLITGGSGLTGTHLTQVLVDQGHEVVHLGRRANHSGRIKTFQWDLSKGFIDPKAFEGVTGIIHLAGASIAGHRWTKAYKKELYDSRILSSRLLVNYIQQHQLTPDVFISASAMGIYGTNTGLRTTESAPQGTDFLAQLCKDWENEVSKLTHTRVVILRTGVVLAKESGFIPKVAAPIRLGAGAVLGKGNQYMSWIHIDDLVNLYAKAVQDPTMKGIYNAVSPNPETNRTITALMAQKLRRPLILPAVPEFVLRILFGELSSTLLASQHLSSSKTEQTGFMFRYPTLQNALDNLL
jgi:uncharacterized protein (TIGR01777 family)